VIEFKCRVKRSMGRGLVMRVVSGRNVKSYSRNVLDVSSVGTVARYIEY
jgi:hypothetical protein